MYLNKMNNFSNIFKNSLVVQDSKKKALLVKLGETINDFKNKYPTEDIDKDIKETFSTLENNLLNKEKSCNTNTCNTNTCNTNTCNTNTCNTNTCNTNTCKTKTSCDNDNSILNEILRKTSTNVPFDKDVYTFGDWNIIVQQVMKSINNDFNIFDTNTIPIAIVQQRRMSPEGTEKLRKEMLDCLK
jgi:hypothetical protein